MTNHTGFSFRQSDGDRFGAHTQHELQQAMVDIKALANVKYTFVAVDNDLGQY